MSQPTGPAEAGAGRLDRIRSLADSWLADEWLHRAAGAGRPQLRTRTVIGAMFAVFLVSSLASGWLHAGVLAGLGFLAGAVAAAWYGSRPALLKIVVSPPALFGLAVLVVQLVTAQGSTTTAAAESVLAGTFLTLSATAPWLFLGMIAAVGVAMYRGLRECVRELRGELRRPVAPPRAAMPGRYPR